ncbi:MAG TPA: cytochrome P450 [Actinomycetota bacterium]|jgi:cytochrome P450|nr:cytochrome P450 [Actinomycetota bacterium]
MTDTAFAPVTDEDFINFVASPQLRRDPYPFYARMRATAPVHRLPIGLVWLATTYDTVSEALRDPRFSNDERNASMYSIGSGYGETPFGSIAEAMMVFRDDPDHKRLRDLVQKAFTRRIIENLRGRIGSLVDELLTPIVDRRDGELMSEFAYPLPVIVICELLGIPAEDRERFMEWEKHFATRFEVQQLRTPEMEEQGNAATVALRDYFDELIESKRKQPSEDLISSLAAVEHQGDRLTHHELLSTCMLLLLAGHETTANLIGNGTYALMRHRDQWGRLVDDPGLARLAVEELLRFDSPVQLIQRIALEEVRLGDETIEKGGVVGVMLGAANRDERHFPDPDRLDIGRGDAPLVAFGAGIHFCLGAPLARLEAQLAFQALAKRAPALALGAEPEWRPTFVLRGLSRLPVTID